MLSSLLGGALSRTRAATADDEPSGAAGSRDDEFERRRGAVRGFECRERRCAASPEHCVHHWLRPVEPDAAYALRASDAARSLTSSDEHAALARACRTIERLLALPVAPATLARCGGDWPRLAACGVTFETLVAHYELDELVDGLELDWRALLALGFTPFALADRARVPVVTLAEHPRVRLRAPALLRAFPLRYDHLVRQLRLSVDDLLALDMDAPLQLAIGMSERDIVAACSQSLAPGRRARGGVAWYYRAFRWSFSLSQKRPLADYRRAEPRLRDAAGQFAKLYMEDFHL